MSFPPAPILLVDDDENDVFLFERALRAAGVDQPIRVVRDGEEALRYLAGEPPFEDRAKHPKPCLLLLDVKLPRKGGLEILRWLRAHPDLNGMPVLMVTSSNEPQDRQEAEENGVEAYRVKPVSFSELVRLAQEVRQRAEEHCK
jgi:CheY-like chemotaxis protein